MKIKSPIPIIRQQFSSTTDCIEVFSSVEKGIYAEVKFLSYNQLKREKLGPLPDSIGVWKLKKLKKQ
ncbi:hypothetical protein EZY14_002650 [Kordia sp. TARA_039_SRF]|nr:hypothetical protein EZY14_002650 [Kordia sp. TARA_039_SRF]